MLLVDANVLVYAHREAAPRHTDYRRWLEGLLGSDEAFGMSDHVLCSFLRVVTHPRVFHPPSTLEEALAFTEAVRSNPRCVPIAPGPRHWEIFTRLCREARVKGNLFMDAWLAALAIESGSEWITTDRDFSRFRGLRWRHPLESA